MSLINIPCNMIICGNSKSGKTTNFKHIYEPIHTKFRHTLLISTTNKLNCEYNELIYSNANQGRKKWLELNKYDESVIIDIMKSQESTIIKLNKKYGHFDNIPTSTKARLHVSIICDDMLGQIDFHHSVFNELFAKSRHLFISIFILQQHINTLSVSMRINAHYVMVTKIKDNNIDTLFDLIQMDDIGTNKADLRRFLAKYCVNYQCILFSEVAFLPSHNVQKKYYKVLKYVMQSDA